MLVVAAISTILVIGIHESAPVNYVIVVIKIAIVIVFILAGAWFVSTANWVTPANLTDAFIPPRIGSGQYGWSRVVRGAAVVFFAYIGFDAVSTAAQEARNPIAILGSLAICTVLYVLVAFVLTGRMHRDMSTTGAALGCMSHEHGALVRV